MPARVALSTRLKQAALGAGLALALSTPAHAIFADDEARNAILELRVRVEAQRQQLDAQRQQMDEQRRQMESQRQQMDEQRRQMESQRQQIVNLRSSLEQQAGAAIQRADEEAGQLRRSLLDLLQQIEGLRTTLAQLRGADEQITRELAEVQRRLRDTAQGIDERLRRFEPFKVTVDSREFMAEPAEQRAFDAAMAVMRRGDFTGAAKGFGDLLGRYPQSGYRGSALFWQGTALYTTRDYNGALAAFRALIQAAPEHVRAPEATLSIANCQVELKDVPAARETLKRLLAEYPQSEAAATARERLARLN